MGGIRHGDCVYATEDLPVTYRKRKSGLIKTGTRGEVKALRELKTDDCRKALVKFEGFGCLKSVNIDQISKDRQTRRLQGPSVPQTVELHLDVLLHVLLPKGLKWDGKHLWRDIEGRVHGKLLDQNVMLRTGVNLKQMGKIVRARIEVVRGSRA